MNSTKQILSREQMLAKYDESGIAERLHLFKKIEKKADYCARRTEVFWDRETRKKQLQRNFLKNELSESETMTVTYLVHDGVRYVADRIS